MKKIIKIIKIIKKYFPYLFLFYRRIRKIRMKYLGLYFSEKLAKEIYRNKFNKELNIDNPKDINEKINWLKYRSDTSIWTILADKYKVREYVKECGFEHMLIDLYGIWNKVDDIQFENLPNSFVLKTNHGCATVILVDDKSKIDMSKIKKQLNKWMKFKFGIYTAEPHYINIKPCIIAEKYLKEESELSTSLIDYKIWCFNGVPYCIMVLLNRTEDNVCKSLYTLDWIPCFDKLAVIEKNTPIIPKPKSLNQMIEASRVLSKSFPQVRVDFYEVAGKPYFGELTFTSLGGYMDYFTPDFLLEMGSKVVLKHQNN